jgi:glycosyltransferase involved in cell wall biosynthesis
VAPLEQRLESLERTLDQLRQLIVATYENTPRAHETVLKVRRDSAYHVAYSANPLVTVRIGTYAGGDLLFDRALSSVRRQSYENWEAVVVCDGPEKETAARIESLNDSRITCVQRPQNGPYPAHEPARWQVAGVHPFNEAVAIARGAWIAPIDQDDEWTDDHLDVLVAAALRAKAEVVYGVGRTVVADYGETYFGASPPAQGDFGFQTAIYHAALAQHFLYDINAYLVGEPADWNLARRMLEAGIRFEFVERVVTAYYLETDTRGIEWWQERLAERGCFSPRPLTQDQQ